MSYIFERISKVIVAISTKIYIFEKFFVIHIVFIIESFFCKFGKFSYVFLIKWIGLKIIDHSMFLCSSDWNFWILIKSTKEGLFEIYQMRRILTRFLFTFKDWMFKKVFLIFKLLFAIVTENFFIHFDFEVWISLDKRICMLKNTQEIDIEMNIQNIFNKMFHWLVIES